MPMKNWTRRNIRRLTTPFGITLLGVLAVSGVTGFFRNSVTEAARSRENKTLGTTFNTRLIPSRRLQNAQVFGVPYGSRTRVAAVKEKRPIVIQRNFAAWIALYRT